QCGNVVHGHTDKYREMGIEHLARSRYRDKPYQECPDSGISLCPLVHRFRARCRVFHHGLSAMRVECHYRDTYPVIESLQLRAETSPRHWRSRTVLLFPRLLLALWLRLPPPTALPGFRI